MPAASALLPSPQNTPGMFSTVRLAAIDGHSPQKSSTAEGEIFRLFKAAGRRNTGVFQGRQRSKTENIPLCGALYSDCIVYIKTRILFQSLNDTLLLAAAISCKPQKRNLIFLQNGVFQRIALKLLRSIFMESKAIHFNH